MGHDGAAPAPVPRRPPGGPAKGDRRRQAIVDAVERLLRGRTIAQLSVENIAAEAGISRSGFYFYFENKYMALGEALAGVADELNLAAEDFFAVVDRAPEEYFPAAQSTVADRWLHHGDLMVAVVDAAHSDAGARALWEEFVSAFITGVAERIESGRQSGEIAPGRSSAYELARVLVIMSQMSFYDLARRKATGAERAATLDALNQVWLDAVWGIRATP